MRDPAPELSFSSLLAGGFVSATVGALTDPVALGAEFLVNHLLLFLLGNGVVVGLVFFALRFLRVSLPLAPGFCLALGLGWLPFLGKGLFLGWLSLVVLLAVPLARWRIWPLRMAPALILISLSAVPLAAWLAPAKNLQFVLHEISPTLIPSPQGKPDLILISVDTLRADRVLDPQFPTFARLRAEGGWVPAARSPSNQTVPGHVAMLTGLGPEHVSVRTNADLLPRGVDTLAQSLHARGYQTGAVVANGLLRAGSGFERGFDFFDDHLVRWAAPGRRFTELAQESSWFGWLFPDSVQRFFLARIQSKLFALKDRVATEGAAPSVVASAQHLIRHFSKKDRPFFLFLHFMDPHTAYRPAENTDPARQLPQQWNDKLDAWGRVQPPFLDDLERALRNSALGAEDEESASVALDWVRSAYDGEVNRVDRAVGEILAMLEQTGRPTRLLLTADHGEHLGEHGLLDHANSLYEELVQVPFVLWGAGVQAGESSLAPGLEQVAASLQSGTIIPPPAVSIARDGHRLALWDGQWKWRLSTEGGSVQHLGLHAVAGSEEGDLGEDLVPLALRRRMEAFLAAEKKLAPATLADEETWALLDAMGYGGGPENP